MIAAPTTSSDTPSGKRARSATVNCNPKRTMAIPCTPDSKERSFIATILGRRNKIQGQSSHVGTVVHSVVVSLERFAQLFTAEGTHSVTQGCERHSSSRSFSLSPQRLFPIMPPEVTVLYVTENEIHASVVHHSPVFDVFVCGNLNPMPCWANVPCPQRGRLYELLTSCNLTPECVDWPFVGGVPCGIQSADYTDCYPNSECQQQIQGVCRMQQDPEIDRREQIQ